MTEREGVSVLALIGGLWMLCVNELYNVRLRRLSRGKTVKGRVEEAWEISGDTSATMISVQFTTEDGRFVRFSAQEIARVGELVDVVYDEHEPENAMLHASIRGKILGSRVLISVWLVLWLGLLVFGKD